MKKMKLNFSLSVSVMREDDRFVAYSPAIDLSTSGKTHQEAKKRFQEAASVFFEEVVERGTMEQVLQELGWRKTSSLLSGAGQI